MKRFGFLLLFLFISFYSFTQITSTRIRDLTIESSITANDYLVTDRAGYSVLKKIVMSSLKTYITVGLAPIASPAFTGTPTTPSPLSSDSSTKIPNTGWVKRYIAGGAGGDDLYRVKYNTNDPTPGFLSTEIVAGTGISLSQVHVGGSDLALQISNSITFPDSLTFGPVNGNKYVDLATAVKRIYFTPVIASHLYYVKKIICGVYASSHYHYRIEIAHGTTITQTASVFDGYYDIYSDSAYTVAHNLALWSAVNSTGVAIAGNIIIDFSKLTLGFTYTCANFNEGGIFSIVTGSEGGGGGITPADLPRIQIGTDTINGASSVYLLSNSANHIIRIDSVHNILQNFTVIMSDSLGDGTSYTTIVKPLAEAKINNKDSIILYPGQWMSIYTDSLKFQAITGGAGGTFTSTIESIVGETDTINGASSVYLLSNSTNHIMRIDSVNNILQDFTVIMSDSVGDGTLYTTVIKPLGGAKINDKDSITLFPGEWITVYLNSLKFQAVSNQVAAITNDTIQVVNGLSIYKSSVILEDSTLITIPSGIMGGGTIISELGAVYANFRFAYNGTVTLLTDCSTEVANTNTADKLCIYDLGDGSGLGIRNNRGISTLNIHIEYSTPYLLP